MSSTDGTPLLLLLLVSLTVSVLPTPSSSATDTFVFGGCSQLKYIQGSWYENSVNSMLTSLVNSAMFTSYNNFTIQGANSQETLYGLFQCRGDLNTADCGRCVSRAVSQLGTLCLDSCGGALQLDGCFVKRDAVLGYLVTSDGSYKPYKVSGSGDITGVAQCVGDLSASECQDCVSDAIGRLKTDCGSSKWGDMFLAKCYARYSEGGDHSHGSKDDDDHNDEEIEKTLAILIGLIAGVALLIIFLSFIRNLCEKGKGGK
ncbi:Cysteine-rich repeat secretory protein like [Melia azedarach]|uniref:Cysteine-rich repeat secretory protein like n=1 Tax=Melia azedarach TaxID=155640 RepID=A0ACC1XF64_MELAZ|nr:Cysteine-rich repeat secretory protein like [Melia azedarach]